MAIKNFKEILQKEAKRIDFKDRNIFERGKMPSFFGRGVTDTIEFILYDNGDNQLPQGDEGKLVRYINISEIDNIRNYLMIARGAASNQSPEYFVDVEKLINEAGYKNGLFRTQITLLNKRVGSEHFQNKVWIHEISPSRTEVRVLPLKVENQLLEKDLKDRYRILLENGEFKDDVLNRLDGFIDSIDANNVIKKVRALYGQDWIDNLKKEFKINDFDGFINDVTVKAKQAIGYFISNRGYIFGKADYGKALKEDLTSSFTDRKRRKFRGRNRKPNSQRLDIATLQSKSMEIICDSIRFHLPKRNLQVVNTPKLKTLESRDKISTILQKFGTSKKIDTKITKVVKVVKPAKVVKATITSRPKEKPADVKPIKIQAETKKYYFYDVYFKRRGFSRSKLAAVEYIDMSGDTNSFSMPSGKRVKICALEGSVKVKSGKGVRITKKELCKIDTPVPNFVTPKPEPDITLTKEQKDAINQFDLSGVGDKIKFDMEKMQDEITANIKKSFENLPKIKFPPIGPIGVPNSATANSKIPVIPFKPITFTPLFQNAFANLKPPTPVKPKPPKAEPVINVKPFSPPKPIIPPFNNPILKNLANPVISFNNRNNNIVGSIPFTPPKPATSGGGGRFSPAMVSRTGASRSSDFNRAGMGTFGDYRKGGFGY